MRQLKRNTADEPSRWFEKNSSSRTSTTSYKVQLHGILFPQECGEPELSEVDYDDSGRFQAPGPSRAPSSSSASPPSASCPQKISFSRNACQKNEKGFFWEIFSGEGSLTNMFQKLGYLCLTPIDVLHGKKYDLTGRSTQMAILRALKWKNVKYLHLGTPCTVFSIARHGITNTARARERERIGCELAFFTAELCRTATSLGIKWSIENPTTSRLWEFPAIRDLQCLPGVQFVNTVMCHFGAPYKKPTSLMTNILKLRGLEAICEHRRHEVVLKGTVQHRDDQGRVSYVNRSKLAG